ncbi:thioesterase family protein [Nocardia salmonicida]|uniref:thioesterase family protein n=1 Tax=Nocardia salmonicida TaxID=53431 RepID=UPI0033E946A0
MTIDSATTPRRSAADFLAARPDGPMSADEHLWGFGGLHGGLSLAYATSAMGDHAGDRPLRAVTAHFHSPVRSDFAVTTEQVREGRSVTTVSAVTTTASGVNLTATGVFGIAQPHDSPSLAPQFPDAGGPSDCEPFVVPPDFLPVAEQTEVRFAGAHRPYSASATPELLAWVRTAGEDTTPDIYRLIVLLDAVAPSYSVLLDQLIAIPTVEFSVYPSGRQVRVQSPWVLVRATTEIASSSGWLIETLDAWSEDGTHLAGARQLRVAVTTH